MSTMIRPCATSHTGVMSEWKDVLTLSVKHTPHRMTAESLIPYTVEYEICEVRTDADGSVSLVYKTSMHRRGFASLDATWSSWTTMRLSVVRQRADGIIEVRTYNHKSRKWATIWHHRQALGGTCAAGDMFSHVPVMREAMHRYFDMDAVPSIHDLYPTLTFSDYEDVRGMKFYRDAADLNVVFERMFGVRRARNKMLVSAFRHADVSSRHDA